MTNLKMMEDLKLNEKATELDESDAEALADKINASFKSVKATVAPMPVFGAFAVVITNAAETKLLGFV